MIREWLLFALTILSAVAGAVWFVVRLIRAAEKRIDKLHYQVYDPDGVNGLVRKVQRVEEEVEHIHDQLEEIRRLLVMRRPMDDI